MRSPYVLPITLLAGLSACAGGPDSAGADTSSEPAYVPWAKERAALSESSPGGRAWRRGIIHLHSHFSHDACDGEPMPGGVPDEDCLASLRHGLCANAIDYAMVTDHPAHAAEQVDFSTLLLSREGDEVVDGVANRIACPGGHGVLTLPGNEDELMPIGLDRLVADSAAERDRLLNATDGEAFDAMIAAGATVLQAHVEERPIELLRERQALGLSGMELFNLHAMVDPENREYLGLDPYGHVAALSPFATGDTDAEPDLAFLGFFQEQTVSVERWDALNQSGFAVGTAGTDAHENALPSLMTDGERIDSYRRMISWFSNVILPDGDSPADYQAAVAAGRLFVAFETLGTPAGFHVGYAGLEMGGEADVGGTLEVTCPTLAPQSPRDGDAPEITVTVFKDGAPWQDGCGAYPVTERGVYRVRVDIVPHHLAGFLDDQAEALVHGYPWLYSNALRIGF